MRRAAIQITPELITELIPLPDECKATGVVFDIDRRLVVVELEGDALPEECELPEAGRARVIGVTFQSERLPCGCDRVSFHEFNV